MARRTIPEKNTGTTAGFAGVREKRVQMTAQGNYYFCNFDDNNLRGQPMNTTIHTEFPPQILRQAELLIERGWATNIQSLIIEAVERYCETHRPELAEQFIRDDIGWGLHGND